MKAFATLSFIGVWFLSVTDTVTVNAQGIVEQVPNIGKDEITSVMEWIKVKVVQSKIPFCWKSSYGRGVGSIPTACPTGKVKIGELCYTRCPAGYTRVGFDCHSVCPSGWADQGLFCRNAEYGRGGGYPWHFGDCLCNDGMIRRCENDHGRGKCEMWGAVAYPKCRSGFSPYGCCLCRPQQPNCPDLGLNYGIDLSCAKRIIIGDPTPMICLSRLQSDAGLCYDYCKAGYYGIGPVCWQSCAMGQHDCAAACTTDEPTCSQGIFDMVFSLAVVAANIVSFGMTKAASGAATVTMTTANGVVKVTSASMVGSTFVTLVNKLSVGMTAIGSMTRMQTVFDAKTGQPIRTFNVTSASADVVQAVQAFEDAFVADFVAQTSTTIDAEINRRFHPATARFLKKAWADVQLAEMTAANSWETASTVLGFIGVIDIAGVMGVVSAYTKPICLEDKPFPCISADLTC
jgi:hypothetical protein